VRFSPALVLAVGILALPAPAGAQVATLREYPGPALTQGPVLTGDQVAWGQTTCVESCDPDFGYNNTDRYEILSAAGETPARRLFRARIQHADSGPNFFHGWYWFRLSGVTLATVRRTYEGNEVLGESGAAELVAGPPAGPREQLFQCSVEYFSGIVPLALDGSRLIYDPDPCDEAAQLVLRDVATGETRELPPSATGSELHLRGRFAAWIGAEAGSARLVVYDLVAGTEAYSAPVGDVRALDLDETGTAAVVTGQQRHPCTTGRLFRYSIATPSPTEIPTPVCSTGVQLGGGGGIVFVGWEGFTRTLRLATPEGRIDDLVRFGRVRSGDFDAEDGRFAWAVRDCGGGEAIFTGKLAEPPGTAGSLNCPARLGSGIVPVSRGRATLRLDCPRGCAGELSLRRIAKRNFALLRGESTVTLRLGRRARARLADRGSLTAIARLVWRNRAGDRLARSGAVMLVAR
jgi:hypothetical protein